MHLLIQMLLHAATSPSPVMPTNIVKLLSIGMSLFTYGVSACHIARQHSL